MVQAVFVWLIVQAVLTRARPRPAINLRHRLVRLPSACMLLFAITSLFTGLREAHADPGIELSGGAGFGAFVAGATPARFAVSPSASLSVRGDSLFFVARNTTSFLGATGGRFGSQNETTLGGGFFGELVNVSARLSLAQLSLPISLAQLSLPICGPRLCGQLRGLAPGADVRLDLFGPYLSGSLGISIDCAGTWFTGGASAVWNGVSLRCSAGPVLRFAPRS